MITVVGFARVDDVECTEDGDRDAVVREGNNAIDREAKFARPSSRL
jgi:hypothetical protein